MTVPAPASAVRVWTVRSRSVRSISNPVVSAHIKAVSTTPAATACPNRRLTAATAMPTSVWVTSTSASSVPDAGRSCGFNRSRQIWTNG